MVGQAKEPVRKTGIKFTGNEACSEAAGSGALAEPPAEESDLGRKRRASSEEQEGEIVFCVGRNEENKYQLHKLLLKLLSCLEF